MDATTGASGPPGQLRATHLLPVPVDEPRDPYDDDAAEPTRFAEFALGSVCLLAVTVPRLPGNLAIGLVAIAVLVLLAAVHRPTRSLEHLRWLPAACVLLLGYLVAVSASSPDDSLYGWPKRAVRLAVVLLFLLTLVHGRVHLPSVIRGAAFGLVVNAVLFYAGVAPNPYGRLLSGFLLDKNQAGLAYGVVGLLLMSVTPQRQRQLAIAASTSAFVWLTGSRTSLAALACGLVWFVARPYLGTWGRLAIGGAMALTIPFVEENYARVGVFAERAGSDQFRATIDAASEAKLAFAPFQGAGLGEAWVLYANGDIFFFHNSYWSALIEGGYPYLVVLLVAHILLAIRPFRAGPPPSLLARGGEAANIVVLVCALRLGEVFGTTVAVLALGAGLVGYGQAARARERAAATGSAPAADLPTGSRPPATAGPVADTVTR